MSVTRFASLVSLFIQAYQFNDYYWIAVNDKNKLDINYKFLVIWAFLALMTPYWISYSGMVSVKYNEDKYSAKNCKNDKWYHSLFKFFFLTFLGPI